MGCNCRKNKVIYTGPPVEKASDSIAQTGGQAPIERPITAGGQPRTPSQ